jgi:Ni/Co efflux regulator RcnB
MEKQRWAQSEKRNKEKIREEKRREEERRSEKRKSQKKEYAGARKGRKVAKHFVFPMEGRKVSGVRSHLARGEMKNCTPMWREAHFEVKRYKTRQLRSTLRNGDVEKVPAVVARSTFRSQKC